MSFVYVLFFSSFLLRERVRIPLFFLIIFWFYFQFEWDFSFEFSNTAIVRLCGSTFGHFQLEIRFVVVPLTHVSSVLPQKKKFEAEERSEFEARFEA